MKRYPVLGCVLAAAIALGVAVLSSPTHAQAFAAAAPVIAPIVPTSATSTDASQVTLERAQVVKIVSQQSEQEMDTSVSTIVQSIQAVIVEGPEAGKDIIVENDQGALSVGETFYVQHTVNEAEGVDSYAAQDPYRLPVLYFFIGLFVVCVLIFGGKQGMRGLVALALSFAAIVYLLLPAILRGWSPALVSIGIAALIIILGSYITHGFNRVTSSAVVGMVVTIAFTGLLAYAAIHFGHLTGFNNEETVYLNMDTGGTIDFAGLLLGGILIGLLGVLYDAAISQAVAVDELHHVAPHLSRRVIWVRAMRIGREHVGALVNTLAIAYVGASLPLLLLFYESSVNVAFTLNQELFATEIIRAMIGSIGLVLAVPLTTLIAVGMLMKKSAKKGRGNGREGGRNALGAGTADRSILEMEEKLIEGMGHKH